MWIQSPPKLTFLFRIIVFRIWFCSVSCLILSSLLPNSTRCSQKRPSSLCPTCPPLLSYLVCSFWLGNQRLYLGESEPDSGLQKRPDHTLSCSLLTPSHPTSSFYSPICSPSQASYAWKRNRAVCDDLPCPLTMEGHTTPHCQRLGEHLLSFSGRMGVTDYTLLRGFS